MATKLSTFNVTKHVKDLKNIVTKTCEVQYSDPHVQAVLDEYLRRGMIKSSGDKYGHPITIAEDQINELINQVNSKLKVGKESNYSNGIYEEYKNGRRIVEYAAEFATVCMALNGNDTLAIVYPEPAR